MDLDSIGNITDFVRQCLKDRKIESAEITKAVLVTEEAAGSLLMHGSGDGELRVSVRGLLGDVVVTGLVLPAIAGPSVCGALDSWILVPLKTVYMNALRMVVAPVVFFSIVSSISGFSNLSELGKVGGRAMMLYLFTTMIAVCVGIGAFCLFRPGGTILSLVGMFGTFLFGLCCMVLIYCLLMAVLGHMSPLPFLRKYFPTMLQVFSMASSNAAIPLNMEFCRKKMEISGRVYNLTIPLGATLNMDGNCIQMAVFSLALAKGCGVDVPAGALVALAFTIIMLSMGAPGMPGAGVICLSVLLEQLHVPTEAVSLVMGIGPTIGMFLCMSNCLGDMVVTTIVAKQAGLMDMKVYRN